ncbi:hypothetical protein ACFY0G_17435 [Streptomyces sp. NPDC001552]|uniref:hypothetical protein n=1 Tax=Streptomyces sp. NPDC001552 TaxID=3364587 RepID=UPI0036A6C46C
MSDDDLSKWARLLVTGTPVTPEQADDILIRTANPYLLDGNDKAWTMEVYGALGLTPGRYGNATTESIREVTEELDLLQLSVLYTSRIASTWVGGPHGWCDWDGTIGSANYNLGRWPDRDTVLAEWELIATQFPYLDLTAQLVADEGTGKVVGQWRVLDGHAAEEPTGPPITRLVELGEEDFFRRVLVPGGERGVSPQRLESAVERVRSARSALR